MRDSEPYNAVNVSVLRLRGTPSAAFPAAQFCPVLMSACGKMLEGDFNAPNNPRRVFTFHLFSDGEAPRLCS